MLTVLTPKKTLNQSVWLALAGWLLLPMASEARRVIGEAIVTTATDVAALLENHSLITASGAGTTPLQPGLVPLAGGGEDFEILTQAHEVVSWLTAENSPALALVNVTGAGETPLQALPPTVLGGGRVHQALTTADEVVSLISGITPLMTITGGGSTALAPLAQTSLGGVTSATTVTTTYAWTPENRLREVDRSDVTVTPSTC